MMGQLWYGGPIYTMQEEGEQVEAVVVHNEQIIAVGGKEELSQRYQTYIQQEINLEGCTMLPGLVDSHMHLIGHGERLMRLDLSACNSYEEMIELVKDRVAQTEAGDWIVGEGWNENAFYDKQDMHIRDLDCLSSCHPIVLKRVCRHALFVNSYVLQQSGITDETTNPKGGKIGRDRNGHINGLLYDQAQNLVTDIMPLQTEEYLQKALEIAVTDCWSYGLVGGHTEDLHYYGGFKRTYEAFERVLKDKPFKAHLLVHHEVVDEIKLYENQHYLEFGAMKIFADGSLGGRTALLSEPYSDCPEEKGVAVWNQEELNHFIQKARTLQRSVAVHAIGDEAFKNVIEAIKQYPPMPGQRDRIIHCQVLRQDLIDRAKQLAVVLDIQPIFVSSDFPSVIEKLGQERLRYAYAWNTLHKEGFVCAGGSDAPIEQVNPFLGIYSAVSRKSFIDEKVYLPKERLTMFEAVSLFTSGSAYAICKEQCRGKIIPGYEADFTIVDRDVFTIQPEELLELSVMMTVVDGIVVYTKERGR
ncbi:amidohydrolase [Microbacteriaceae bacterium 4G12]